MLAWVYTGSAQVLTHRPSGWALAHILVYLCSAMLIDLMFLETSALNGENVEEAFLKCTRTILAKIESGKLVLLSVYTMYLQPTLHTVHPYV